MPEIAPIHNTIAAYPYNLDLFQWTLAEGDTARPVSLPSGADRSVQIEGTPGGATVTIQGTLDGANYRTLRDAVTGNALSFTAFGAIRQIAELTAFIKPVLAGGSGTTNAVISLLVQTRKV